MENCILQEYKPYSFQQLQDIFQLSEAKLEGILKTLSLMNIVKHKSKSTIKTDFNEIFDVDFDIDELLNSTKGVYLFSFVGIINLREVNLIIYPKYLTEYQKDKQNKFVTLKQLINVIRKYDLRTQRIGYSDHAIANSDEFNLLSLAIHLIENYAKYGLYDNKKEVVGLNGEGEILWEKTIDSSTAYFSNGRPIYIDYYTVNTESDTADYFKRLHAAVISDAGERMSEIFNIIGIEPMVLSSEPLHSFGNTEYILYRINQEISIQFVTHKQEILHTIRKYILKQNAHINDGLINFVGTNAFHLVWEDVCKVIMGDCSHKSLNQLNLQYADYSSSRSLLEVISKPLWTHKQSNKQHQSTKTLIPDIIVIEDNSLSIYDAKYYTIKLNENILKNNPSVGDISKQYLYELAFRNFADSNNLEIIKNAFLMPTDGDSELTLGEVTLDFFHNQYEIGLKPIEIILFPCQKAYSIYLSENKQRS